MMTEESVVRLLEQGKPNEALGLLDSVIAKSESAEVQA
jgi:hypothetical protein